MVVVASVASPEALERGADRLQQRTRFGRIAHSWFSEEVQQAPEGVAVLVERELDDAGPTEGV